MNPLALTILTALCLISALAPSPGQADGEALALAEDQGGPSISHKMTSAEASAHRAAFGVRDPAIDYNVMVDGHGTGKAPPTEEAYEAIVGRLNVLDYLEPMALPSAFDLSASPSFPTVGNQGAQGSCTAWATTYYAYGYIEAVDHGWTEAKAGNASQLLSPAWTYNKVNGGLDRGSWEWDNMMILKDWGTSTMADLPYNAADFTDWGSPTAFREAPLHRIYEAFRIPYVGASTVETVKTLITGGTPVTFGIDANGYNKAFKDGNYILTAAEYKSIRTNHANTFVGFDDSVTDDGEVGAFRVVNSWGSAWGEAGYYWLTYDAFMEMSDLLDLCFVEDIADYSPSMRATWQFDPAPSRDGRIEVAVGTYGAPVLSKTPYYWLSNETALRFPAYMCIDISEFGGVYGAGTCDFYVSMDATAVFGTLDGFKVELFESTYIPATTTQCSGEAWNDPQATPGHIDLSFPYYSPVSLSAAVDTAIPVVSDGDVLWVGVDHEWSTGGDSVQSGCIGDLEESRLTAQVLGPATVGFEWRVSSEATGDLLVFEGNGGELAVISGDIGWEAVSFDFGAGTHTLSWTYSKDDSGSDLDDCGWVDNLTISWSAPMPPVAGFEVHPAEGDTTTVFEFDASGSYDPDDPGAALSVRWDWNGDGTWDTEWSDALVAYHVFGAPGTYTVRLEVMDADGLTDVLDRDVTVLELIPEFGPLAGPLSAAMMAFIVVAFSIRRRRSGQDGLGR